MHCCAREARERRSSRRPVDHGYEVRCFFRDPDGHLLELSEISG